MIKDKVIQWLGKIGRDKREIAVELRPYRNYAEPSYKEDEGEICISYSYPSSEFPGGTAAGGDRLETWRAESQPLASNLNITVGLRYIDRNGKASERKVEVHSLLKSPDGIRYIRGFCHLRGSWRTFREDRIDEIIDLATGEIMSPAGAFFDRYSLFEGRELEKLQMFLHILSYLSRSDRRFTDDEKRVIRRVIADFYTGPKSPLIEEYAFEHRITKKGFLEEVERLKYLNEEDVQYLLRRAKEIIEADGKVTASEEKLFRLLEEIQI